MADNNKILEGCKFSVNDLVLCYEPDPLKARVLYDAKILDTDVTKDDNGKKVLEYYIHFQGWNKSWDRWVLEDQILEIIELNRALQRKLYDKAKRRKAKRNRGDSDEKDDKSLTSSMGSTNSDDTRVSQLPLISLDIPKVLAVRLEDDCYNIKRKKKLVHLPRNPTVNEIFNEYYAHCEKIAKAPQGKEICLNIVYEMLQGLNTYFNFYLFTLLLYNFEREQYHKFFPPGKENQPEMIKRSTSPIKPSTAPFKKSNIPNKSSSTPIKTATPIKPSTTPMKSTTPKQLSVTAGKPSHKKLSTTPKKASTSPIKPSNTIKQSTTPIKPTTIKPSTTPIKSSATPTKPLVTPTKLANRPKLYITPIKPSTTPVHKKVTSSNSPKLSVSPKSNRKGMTSPLSDSPKSNRKGITSLLDSPKSNRKGMTSPLLDSPKSNHKGMTSPSLKDILKTKSSRKQRKSSSVDDTAQCSPSKRKRNVCESKESSLVNNLKKLSVELDENLPTRAARSCRKSVLQEKGKGVETNKKKTDEKNDEKNQSIARLKVNSSDNIPLSSLENNCNGLRRSVRSRVSSVDESDESLPIGSTAKTLEKSQYGRRRNSKNSKTCVDESDEKDDKTFMSYPQNSNGNSPADIYGIEHLLRLFVKLPILLSCASMEETKMMIILQHVSTFLEYLSKRTDLFVDLEVVYSESII